jgi:hypothetical protein
MTHACCSARTAAGAPCAARPLPGRTLCFFHDPDRAAEVVAARSKGGSTPRRRFRRLPQRRDPASLTRFLGDLLVAAMNHPEAVDTGRLETLTRQAAALLEHAPPSCPPTRTDPPPASARLVRADPPRHPKPAPHSVETCRFEPGTGKEQVLNRTATHARTCATGATPSSSPASSLRTARDPLPPTAPPPPAPNPAHLLRQRPPVASGQTAQPLQQAPNRPGTGLPRTTHLIAPSPGPATPLPPRAAAPPSSPLLFQGKRPGDQIRQSPLPFQGRGPGG